MCDAPVVVTGELDAVLAADGGVGGASATGPVGATATLAGATAEGPDGTAFLALGPIS